MDGWVGVGGTVLGALIGFLASTYTQRRASEEARKTALTVVDHERAAGELTARYALAQELRANLEMLRLAVPKGDVPQLGRVQRVAWHQAIGVKFSDLAVREKVLHAYVVGSVLDVALDGVLGQTANTSAESWNRAVSAAAVAFDAFEEAERMYRANELPESKTLRSHEHIA